MINLIPGPWYSASRPAKAWLWFRWVLPYLLASPWFYARAAFDWYWRFRALPVEHIEHNGQFGTKRVGEPFPVGGGEVSAIVVSPARAAQWRRQRGWSRAGRFYSMPRRVAEEGE